MSDIVSLNGYNIKDKIARTKVESLGVILDKFNIKGDGISDDTEGINTALQYCKNNNIGTLCFPDGDYVISDSLLIDFSNFTLKGTKNSVLKYVGDGTSGDIITITGTNADNYVENIIIDGIRIDGTEQVYKGGYSMETPNVTHTNPCYRGLNVIKINFAKNVKILNNTFNEIYGDGIVIGKSTDIQIDNNSLYNISSGNIQYGGQTGYDNHGDAIVSFSSYNVSFSNNTIENKRTYQDGMSNAIGKPCGRSGLEFEYPINVDYENNDPDDVNHNAPGYENIPTTTEGDKEYRYGFALRITNNYVYGYTKGVHLESRVKAFIKDNNIVYNHIGMMCSVSNETLITGNYVNTFGIGQAPQSGYDGYYGGISISQYGANETRYGIFVNNNVIEGDGNGIVLGQNHVTISNNVLKARNGIYTILANLEYINILNNTFNKLAENYGSFIYIYNGKNCLIEGNDFYSKYPHRNIIAGNNMKINNNNFFNTFINSNWGGNNITFTNNTIDGDNFNYPPVLIDHPSQSYIGNNVFYATNDTSETEKYLLQLGSATLNTIVENNKFYVNNNRTTAIIKNEGCTETTFKGNKLFGNGSSIDFINCYTFTGGYLINNEVENPKANFIKATGNFNRIVHVDKNIGKLTSSGYKPNDSLTRIEGAYFELSQKVYKYNINSSSTNIGWICVSEGWYVNTTWSTGTSYNTNTKIKNTSNNIYLCVTKGSETSTVEPTHTTDTDVEESDGYVWRYLGPVAVLKDLPL